MTTLAFTTSRLARGLWSNSALRTVVPIFVVLRIVTLVLAFWSVRQFPPTIDWNIQPIHYQHDQAIGTSGQLFPWLEPWYRWDTGWYIYIAYNDYHANDGTIIFAPLYPLAIRVVGSVSGGKYLLAALLISNSACFAAMLFLYKIVERDFSAAVARHTLMLYMVFPSAFFLLAGYTESLFLAFFFAAWYALQREKFVIAGLLAILSSMSRSQGWTLIFPFAYIAYIEPMIKLPGFRGTVREFLMRLFAVTGGMFGTVLYLGTMALAGWGNVNEAYEVLWEVKIRPPWLTIQHAIQVLFTHHVTYADIINVASLFFLLSVGTLVVKRLQPQYWLYYWMTFAFILMRSYEPVSYEVTVFLSLVRYTLTLFPAFIALALVWQQDNTRSKVQRTAYIVFAAVVQVVLMVMFAAALWVA